MMTNIETPINVALKLFPRLFQFARTNCRLLDYCIESKPMEEWFKALRASFRVEINKSSKSTSL